MASESALVGIDATLPVVVRIGRPRVDRAEARLLLEARLYSDAQIARALTCSTKTVRRIRAELIESGGLVVEGRAKSFDKREADFDAECFRAKGTSFKEWIVGKRSKAGGMRVYRHCRVVWSSPDFWDKPSLVRVMDAKDRLADQLAEKWLKRFATKEEKASLRDRLNYIRPLFEWLRRPEINDEFFYVSASRSPKRVRRLPEIEFTSFPETFSRIMEEMIRAHPEEADPFILFKLVLQGRTGGINYQGQKGTDYGILGLRKGGEGTSYLIMKGPEPKDEYAGEILEKRHQTWSINHLPQPIKRKLWEVYKNTEDGEPLFGHINYNKLLITWKRITKKYLGREFTLHDVRKMSLTWYYVLGVPFIRAVRINIGWKSLDTAFNHYGHISGLIGRTKRLKYKANLEKFCPWFVEGVDEFTREKDDDELNRNGV